MDGRHQGLVKQDSGGMYKDCQRQKSVENVTSNGCRTSAMKKTKEKDIFRKTAFKKVYNDS